MTTATANDVILITTTTRKGAAVTRQTPEQIKLLTDLESKITKGLKGFLLAAPAIWAIFDGNLYRAQHKSFAAYMRTRWEMDSTVAGRYRDAGKVLSKLSDYDKLPTNESQCRQLSKLPDDDLHGVWSAVLMDDQKITSELIDSKIKEVTSDVDSEEESKTTTKLVTARIIIDSVETAVPIEITEKDIPSVLRSLAKIGKFGGAARITIEW